MFYLNKDTELTVDLLYKMISKFNLEVEPKLRKYKNYYDGLQAIMNKSYKDATKPCNKTVINYTSGEPTTSYSVSMMGKTGANGKNGTSISITSKSVTLIVKVESL